jgi:serine/threonine-protein kinase
MTAKELNNRYQIIQTLGSGGFGDTFLAEDTQMPSRRRCVIKQLRPIHHNPQIYQLVQERFQREAAILEVLGGASDQIPALYAYFSAEGQFYLVQEWVEGDTLTAKMHKQGPFTETAVQELLLNLLPVLEYIHSQGIIHRDIKPDNIIIRHRDRKPVLIDFGAVRESMGTLVNSQGEPTSSIVIGTPGFMPSEQAAGRPVYSSDLYSLGITAIYLLTGKKPQELETDPQTGEIIWRQHINQLDIAAVIDRAIAYHPRDRYSTAKAMLEALQEAKNPLHLTQPVAEPKVSGNRHNIILIGGGLMVAVVLGLVVIRPKMTQPPAPVISPQPVKPSTDNYLWLSQRSVTDGDLADKNSLQLDIMRNTIFAIHGRRFDTPGLQVYFNQQPWYRPRYSPREFPTQSLSKLEQQNVEVIAKYQDSHNLRYFR